MRPRFLIVLTLDLILLLSLCALEHVPFTGMTLHEWLGLAIAVLIVIHLLLSWSWITASTRRFFRGASNRTRVNYVLNLSLFAFMVAVIFSGVLSSQQALPALASANTRWARLHDRFSDGLVALAATHLAINWDWLLAAARKILVR
jgi:cytochrome b